MRIISTTTSIALGFAFIISSAVLAAQFFGLFPDRTAALSDGRLRLAHVVADQCSAAADANSVDALRTSLKSLLASNPELLSAGIRAPDGTLLVEAGPHHLLWKDSKIAPEHGHEIAIPIQQNNDLWATVELHFAPLEEATLLSPIFRVTLFVAASGFLGSLFFLKKVLKHLDPSSVIPDRVRAMLDALAEGVLIIDNSEQIVMANDAFCRIACTSLDKIQGRRLPDITWLTAAFEKDGERFAWFKSIQQGATVRRESIHVNPTGNDAQRRTLVINAVPILGTNGTRRGVLATFDDTTGVEEANAQLRTAMDELHTSRDEITRKNRELELLASRDPLTSCLNRRSFLKAFEDAWAKSHAGSKHLACIMLDIDHFKQVNDQYGHSVGDQVLKQMGTLLHTVNRSQDLICRYGGEEFCILLPDTAFDDAHAVAERIRQRIEAATWPVTVITASIGVSGIEAGAPDPRQLLDQADKSLYAAKRIGRNRVIPWGDPVIDDAAAKPTEERRGVAHGNSASQTRQIANALFEALRQRDLATALHSRRVADLVASVSEVLCTDQEAEFLAVGALMHDIGKLAIPDAILKKPGPLSKEEWAVMNTHEALGADLVDQAIGNPELTALVRLHHAWFGGSPTHPELPTGNRIPKTCRILLIADAYDALTSDRCYRKGTSHEKAAAELRRCAGTQFDPALLEKFLAHVRTPDRLIDALTVSELSYAATSLEKLATDINDLTTLITSAHGTPTMNPSSESHRP